MATITLTIPDVVALRVLDAVAQRWNLDPASGLTKAQFAKLQIINILKETVRMYDTGAQQVLHDAQDSIDTQLDIT